MAQIVTVGGSIAGLATALVLSEKGHHITVLESDVDPSPSTPEEAWERWPRRGVAHLRGTHMFLAKGLDVLRDRAPDVVEDLKRAGAQELPVPGFERDGGAPLTRLACRRTTFEMVLRRAVLGRPSVRFIPGTNVVGLLDGRSRDSGIPTVTGVRTAASETFPADLVVDASGRRSAFSGWLEGLGARVPAEESPEATMSAYTRWFRARNGEAAPDVVQTDLGYAGAVVAPADNGMFSVTLAVFGVDPVLKGFRHEHQFMAVLERLPAIAPLVQPGVAEPVGGVRFLGGLSNRMRRLTASGRPVVTGAVYVGDAAMCTNPRFGRGVTLAMVHAALLSDVLLDHDDPVDVAHAFGQATAEELEPWFHQSTADDAVRTRIAMRVRAGEPWESIGRAGDDPAVRLARGMVLAMQVDPFVRSAVLRNVHLLDKPSVLRANGEVRARAEALWREHESDPPPQPGPSYAEMCALLSSLAIP